MRNATIALVILSGIAAAGPAAAQNSSEVQKGMSLAVQLCSTCHQVTPSQRRPMRVYNAETHTDQATLSFMEIAERNGRDSRFVSNIIDQPHYPMRRTVLSDAEKQAIIAYIQSLNTQR